jgi:hypothetical protein
VFAPRWLIQRDAASTRQPICAFCTHPWYVQVRTNSTAAISGHRRYMEAKPVAQVRLVELVSFSAATGSRPGFAARAL